MVDKPFDLGAFLDEHAEAPQGQGLVCQMEVEGGWMLFPSPRGVAQSERFFSAIEFGEDAEQMATEVAGGHGVEARLAVQITLFADSVLGADEPKTWKNGRRVWQHLPWQEAYADVFKPSFEAAAKEGFIAGRHEWVHVTFEPDPWQAENRPDEDTKWVPQIQEYLVTKEAAEAYAESNLDGGISFEIPPEPAEWSEVAEKTVGPWKKFARAMGEDFIRKPNQKPKESVWEDAGVTKDVVKEIKLAALKDNEDDLPF